MSPDESPRSGPAARAGGLVLRYRRVLVIAVHLVLWTASFLGAFVLRFDFHVPDVYLRAAAVWLPVLLGLRVAAGLYYGMFRGLWRYTGSRDLVALVKVSTITSAVLVTVMFFLEHRVPRSVFIIDWLASIMLVGGLRFSIRTIREIASQATHPTSSEQRKLLIVGAGDAGEMLVREVQRTHGHRYHVVGFVDDDPSKIGGHIHGATVLGPVDSVPQQVENHGVQEIILAIPSASGADMRHMIEICRRADVPVRTLPSVDGVLDGRVNVSQLRDVAIEDLLGRAPVTLDNQAISAFLRGKVVMVTGAGGSIGSELCRQVCKFGPKAIILVEQAENNLFHIHRALLPVFPDVRVVPRIADICDSKRLEQIFSQDRPQVVFHAAAHKHVPMMEENPGEAIKNNVFGTKKLADFACAYGVEKFVMVSTDKAVNPTSIMGVSKRAAEIYVQALSQRERTQFITVRFGNVLGSAGSVIPLFQEQIAKGGPVMVTHPDMKRYFMTIPEASQLIMQAGTMGQGGEIFLLDMGEPVRIVDLARDLISLSGLKPGEDIEIQFTGMRPGEKLFEELATDGENIDKTRHPKIFIGRFRPHAWDEIAVAYERLARHTDGADPARIKAAFQALVPEYTPSVAKPLPGAAEAKPQDEPTPEPERPSHEVVPVPAE